MNKNKNIFGAILSLILPISIVNAVATYNTGINAIIMDGEVYYVEMISIFIIHLAILGLSSPGSQSNNKKSLFNKTHYILSSLWNGIATTQHALALLMFRAIRIGTPFDFYAHNEILLSAFFIGLSFNILALGIIQYLTDKGDTAMNIKEIGERTIKV